MNCPKCSSTMLIQGQITFAAGPARRVWVCSRHANHVKLEEIPGEHAQAQTSEQAS